MADGVRKTALINEPLFPGTKQDTNKARAVFFAYPSVRNWTTTPFKEAAMKTRTASSELREVMDIRQASEYLGISPDTLYKYASEGTIPAFKLGNRWRFKRSRMDEWMDDQSSATMASSRIALMPTPIVEKETRVPEHARSKPPASVRPRQKRPSRLVN